ncbi:MAG: modA [Jatrophihabitantaceae bacterium]|nr:modA [Jatrophihabitantaceae bacterium]
MQPLRSLLRIAPALALLTAAGLIAGCGASAGSDSGNGGGSPRTDAAGSTLSGTIVVSAAASLTGTFDQIKADFTKANPGVTVTISYGGSDTLAAQINAGAPVDVFAAASDKTMALVVDGGNAASTATRFATNTLEIAVPKDNPAKIAALADLARSGVKLALCAPTVPCGAASAKVLAAANLTVTPVTQEQDVKSVLTKVQLGEVDAGLVYKTDVIAAGSTIKGIAFPEAAGAATNYPVVVCKQAPNAAVAKAFVDYVLSAAGQKVLAAAGFAAP